MSAIVGTAGWSLPTSDAARFAAEGSALERYASRFAGVEINSSFHRPHRRSTWERWAATVPPGFRFSAKLPKAITHVRKLVECGEALAGFAAETAGLGEKLAVLLVQLPPSLAFDETVADPFFAQLGRMTNAAVVCEPRHPSWFEPAADDLLDQWRVARAGADPARVPAAASPGGWPGLRYLRLHGSPQIYRSSYDDERLEGYARLLRDAHDAPAWCIFDNTAGSAATGNALALTERLSLSTAR